MKYSPQLSLVMFLGMRSKPNANSPVHKSFTIWWTTPSLPWEAESTGEDGDMTVNQEVSVYSTVKALNRKISHLGTINPSAAKIFILGHHVSDVCDLWVVLLLWPLFLGIYSLSTFSFAKITCWSRKDGLERCKQKPTAKTDCLSLHWPLWPKLSLD